MTNNASNFIPIFKSSDTLFSLYQDDCNLLLPHMKEHFDLIFADPPYFLSNNGLSYPKW